MDHTEPVRLLQQLPDRECHILWLLQVAPSEKRHHPQSTHQAKSTSLHQYSLKPRTFTLTYYCSLHHFTSTSQPSQRLEIYTWPDCSLKELAHLVSSALPAPAQAGTRMSFSLVYPNVHVPASMANHVGQYTMKDMGTVIIGQDSPRNPRRTSDNQEDSGQPSRRSSGYASARSRRSSELDTTKKTLAECKLVVGDWVSCTISTGKYFTNLSDRPSEPRFRPPNPGFRGGRQAHMDRQPGYQGRNAYRSPPEGPVRRMSYGRLDGGHSPYPPPGPERRRSFGRHDNGYEPYPPRGRGGFRGGWGRGGGRDRW